MGDGGDSGRGVSSLEQSAVGYYRLEQALLPAWQGEIVYNESVMFVPDPRSGEIGPGHLLYEPDEVLHVYSANMQTQYCRGVDYEVEGNLLYRNPGGSIPCFTRDEYFLREPASVAIESTDCPGRYVRYEPGGVEYLRRQVAVTYCHSGRWEGVVPEAQGHHLPETMKRLRSGRPLHLLIYGDSVMEGCDASGRTGVAPYLPALDMLVTVSLSRRWKHGGIRLTNNALGGADSDWGRENAGRLAADVHPDLVVMGFGMNDGSRQLAGADYEANIRAILAAVREEKDTAEFLLLPPGLPNPDCKGWTGKQEAYEPILMQIARDTPGCAALPLTRIHGYVTERKRYADICGNGVNHPNDFMVRLYAAAILETLR